MEGEMLESVEEFLADIHKVAAKNMRIGFGVHYSIALIGVEEGSGTHVAMRTRYTTDADGVEDGYKKLGVSLSL